MSEPKADKDSTTLYGCVEELCGYLKPLAIDGCAISRASGADDGHPAGAFGTSYELVECDIGHDDPSVVCLYTEHSSRKVAAHHLRKLLSVTERQHVNDLLEALVALAGAVYVSTRLESEKVLDDRWRGWRWTPAGGVPSFDIDTVWVKDGWLLRLAMGQEGGSAVSRRMISGQLSSA